MALPKPTASKAPAVTQPFGGWPISSVSDPCCIPGGAGSYEPHVVNQSGDSAGDTSGITSFVMEPGSH